MILFKRGKRQQRDSKAADPCDMACRAEAALRRLRDKQAWDSSRFR